MYQLQIAGSVIQNGALPEAKGTPEREKNDAGDQEGLRKDLWVSDECV